MIKVCTMSNLLRRVIGCALIVLLVLLCVLTSCTDTVSSSSTTDHKPGTPPGTPPETPKTPPETPEIDINPQRRTYAESVIPVEWKEGETTTTVVARNLKPENKVYVVKTNPTGRDVGPQYTGAIQGTVKNDAGKSRSALNNQASSTPVLFEPINHPVKQQQPSSRAAVPIEEPYIGMKKTDTFIEYRNSLPIGVYVVQSELVAIEKDVIVWTAYYQTYQSLENLRLPLEPIFPKIPTGEQITAFLTKFGQGFERLSNLYGYTGQTNRFGSKKIIIDLYQSCGDWEGYFDSREFDTIYASSHLTSNNLLEVVFHEAQHLLTHSIKGQQQIPTWYHETLAELAVIVLTDPLGLSVNDPFHPMGRLSNFVRGGYSQYSITETYNGATAWGLYLLLNHGGIFLLRDMVTNSEVGFASINSALDKYQPGLTVEAAFNKLAEALIYSGPLTPVGALSFDKTFSATYNGIAYTISGFDPWSDKFGPTKVFPVNHHAAICAFSFSIQSSDEWQGISGDLAITVQRPLDPGIQLYLIVK